MPAPGKLGCSGGSVKIRWIRQWCHELQKLGVKKAKRCKFPIIQFRLKMPQNRHILAPNYVFLQNCFSTRERFSDKQTFLFDSVRKTILWSMPFLPRCHGRLDGPKQMGRVGSNQVKQLRPTETEHQSSWT